MACCFPYNGACVTDCATNETLFSQSMSDEVGKEILAHLAKFEVKPMVAHKDYMYVNNVYDCMITAPPHGLQEHHRVRIAQRQFQIVRSG